MKNKILKLAGGAVASYAVLMGAKNLISGEKKSGHCETIQPPKPSGLAWDHNWDRRALESSVRPPKKEADLEAYEQRLTKAQPTAVRSLILVRHGQYEGSKSNTNGLTKLGRQQADLAGRYLQSLDLPIDRIVWSTKTRATETGQIIAKYFEDVPTEGCQLLEEGMPPLKAEPENPEWTWVPHDSEFFIQGARMEAAFRRYFHRASASQTKDSYEIVACHANVIRYCLLRALQMPPEAFNRFSADNASITWVEIAPNGHVNILRFGDTGFIPFDDITDNMTKRD